MVDLSEFCTDPETYKKLSATKIEKDTVRRTCYNPECTWEGDVEVDLRFCPACEYDLKGWKPQAVERMPVYNRRR